MAARANPKLIGAFVLGAIALAVAGVIIFAGTGWFQKRNLLVAYFPGSISGLRVGAPVTWRGVQIGQVTDIKVVFTRRAVAAQIPVVFELDPSRLVTVGEWQGAKNEKEAIKALIDKGLRAQLEVQSMLTGLLYVNLDFFPDAPPPKLVGKEAAYALPYPEVPTRQSQLGELKAGAGKVLERLPQVVDRLNDLLETLDQDVSASSDDFRRIMGDVAEITDRLYKRGPKLDQALDDAAEAIRAVRSTAETVDTVVQANSGALADFISEWTQTAASARRVADQMNNLLGENREAIQDFTSTGLYEYTGLAQDAQQMVNTITRATEKLERDPARFLFGNQYQGVRPEE